MVRIIGLAVVLISLSKITLAADAPAYVAPPPTGDPKSTIVSGILMIVNGVIMAEADRRHQDCATFVSGLDPRGFPMFRHACRIPDNNTRKTGLITELPQRLAFFPLAARRVPDMQDLNCVATDPIKDLVRVSKNKSHSHFGTFRHGRRG
jgi:hypothetical protein